VELAQDSILNAVLADLSWRNETVFGLADAVSARLKAAQKIPAEVYLEPFKDGNIPWLLFPAGKLKKLADWAVGVTSKRDGHGNSSRGNTGIVAMMLTVDGGIYPDLIEELWKNSSSRQNGHWPVPKREPIVLEKPARSMTELTVKEDLGLNALGDWATNIPPVTVVGPE